LLLYILAGLALMESPTFFAVRALKLTELRKQITAAGGAATGVDLVEAYFVLTLIPAALAEGFALFGAVIYFVTASPLALLGPLLGVAVLIALLPTRYKFDSFVENVARPDVL
jgi:hypothetical protein